jgi:PAS domain S-box-containing protein
MSEFPAPKPVTLLADVEQHFGQLVAGVQDYAIFLMDADGYIRTWNAGAQRIKGYAPEEIIGQHFSKFYPPEANATAWPQTELRIAGEAGRFEDEGWRVRKDGSQFWASVVITALRQDDGQVSGFLKVTRDLTERKQTEEALRQSEERFRLLVEGVQDYAIFMLDPEGCVVSWNVGAERIHGYHASEIVGQHFSLFYPSEAAAEGRPAIELEAALKLGRTEDEGWRVRKDRSLFWANVVVTALRDKEGRLRGYAKVTRDLTERLKVEELKVADQQKNHFLAMLAHELRNPLAPIRNGIELLRMPHVDPASMDATTEMMERQVGHLVHLVDDLLDVSRIISGKVTLRHEPLDLRTIVSRAAEEVQPALDARGHELMVTLPSRPLVVDADAVRLAQVFSNLLTNAAKYSPQPSQIWLAAERDNDEAVVRVRDQGVGISEEFLPHIFKLFAQADESLARTEGGLGIGLTLVKNLVNLHGGAIAATSAGRGHGSEFVVRLPISQESLAPATPKLAGDAAPKARRKVLVVDDNVDAAVTVSALLKAWGHDVQTVYDGTAALEAARGFRPDVILLDIGLPGLSGYEVVRQLRAEQGLQNTFITALTGYGQAQDRAQSQAAGFDYHLTKPPNTEILEALIASPETFLAT